MQLNVLHEIPEGLLEVSLDRLDTVLAGPTLIHLSGEKPEPLFLSTLLHGNETSGFIALQRFLGQYKEGVLPRAMSIFLGNVPAAVMGVRCLPGQPDFNRIWDQGDTPEHAIVQAVLAEMKQKTLFASVDIHNNTGKNPHYACVNRLDPSFLSLASIFSSLVVYFTSPKEVQSNAFATLCPAVVLEAGVSGDQAGLQHILSFLDTLMQLETIDGQGFDKETVQAYHTVCRVELPASATVAIGQERQADFCFIEGFDAMNFTPLPKHTLIGWRRNLDYTLSVLDSNKQDVSDQFIIYQGDEIRTKIPLMPSMFTEDVNVIYQDCVGYFMESIQL